MNNLKLYIAIVLLFLSFSAAAVTLPTESYSPTAYSAVSTDLNARSTVDSRFMLRGAEASVCTDCDNLGKDDPAYNCYNCCVNICHYIPFSSEQKECDRRCRGISLPLSGGEWLLVLLAGSYAVYTVYNKRKTIKA